MLILNDIHLGFSRAAGTTPASREKLRTYLFESLRQTLAETCEKHLLVNGDLFDGFEIDPRDWVATYQILSDWLGTRGDFLTLVAGNHDWSPKGSKVSSFEMLAEVLTGQFPYRAKVVGIDQWTQVEPGVIALAHCSNQDIFNLKLEEIEKNLLDLPDSDTNPVHVLVHANYDNNFAVESDHSLNIDREMARRITAAGCKLVFAHVHQARTTLAGKVVILGNQWPTSVADCLGNDRKFAHILRDGSITPVETWAADGVVGSFKEIDWRELAESNADFVRVTGQASSNEASEVINAISQFRQKSECFVITNAVRIDGVAEAEALPATFEAVKKFDVLDFMSKHLDPDEMTVVKELLETEA